MAERGPISSTPTLLYFAGVPGDSKPSIQVTASGAGPEVDESVGETGVDDDAVSADDADDGADDDGDDDEQPPSRTSTHTTAASTVLRPSDTRRPLILVISCSFARRDAGRLDGRRVHRYGGRGERDTTGGSGPDSEAVEDLDPSTLIQRRRPPLGISAVLLPFTDDGEPDLAALESLLDRTRSAGLVPAVNMDTGYGNLLTAAERAQVLAVATTSGDPDDLVVAGAWVDDEPGAPFDPDGQARALEEVAAAGAVPVVFPSFGLNGLGADELVEAHRRFGERVGRFIGFELGQVFSPAGRIWDLDTYAGIMAVPACIGAKHSSLRREPEWERLRLRDRLRPDFHVFTGNDLAIDMIAYGSDYLLGLSAFAPDLFGARDRAWAEGDPSFHERNDDLQALGSFSFRAPVPAYKHDAALFLHQRGWLPNANPHPGATRRPDADRAVLAALLERLERWS